MIHEVSNTQFNGGNHRCDAAKDNARKKPATLTNAPTAPPGACAKTSGSARKVMADEPFVTVASGSELTARLLRELPILQ